MSSARCRSATFRRFLRARALYPQESPGILRLLFLRWPNVVGVVRRIERKRTSEVCGSFRVLPPLGFSARIAAVPALLTRSTSQRGRTKHTRNGTVPGLAPAHVAILPRSGRIALGATQVVAAGRSTATSWLERLRHNVAALVVMTFAHTQEMD